jgi:hypothetical protein
LRILQALSVATEMTFIPTAQIVEKKNATHLAFPSPKDLFDASNHARSGRLLRIRWLLRSVLWAVPSALLRAAMLRPAMRSVLSVPDALLSIQLLPTVLRNALLRMRAGLSALLLSRRQDTDYRTLRQSVFRDHLLRVPGRQDHSALYQGNPERRPQATTALMPTGADHGST